MLEKTKLKLQKLITWLKQNKLLSLPILIFILVLIPLTFLLLKKGIHITPQAEVDDVDLYLNPASAQIAPNEQKNFHIMLNVRTNHPPFMRVAFTFDKNKINLTNEIITTSLMSNVIEKTSMTDANSQGRVVIVLAVPPDESLPTGIMEFANFTVEAITSTENDITSINFDNTDTQIVDTSEEQTNLIASGTSLTLNYTPAATPTPSQMIPLSIPISQSSDDAEEKVSDGSMYLDSSDLEMVLEYTEESSLQTIGLRFANVSIPQGASINRSYIQFKVDEPTSEATSLTIHAQAADNPPTFSSNNSNISSRPKTTTSVNWNPPAWNTDEEKGVDQRTTDLSPLIQQIINRSGWNSENSIVFIFTGSGKRVAESYDYYGDLRPTLYVEYYTSTTTTPIPTIAIPSPTSIPTSTATLAPKPSPTPALTPGICSCQGWSVTKNRCNPGYSPYCTTTKTCKCQ